MSLVPLMMLLTSEGEILAVNKPLASLWGVKSKDLTGKNLEDLVTESSDHLGIYLKSCSRSRQFVLGSLTLPCREGKSEVLRCQGAVVRPRSNEVPALIVLRLEARATANQEFKMLNQKIEALTQEIHQRKQAEAELSQANQYLKELLEEFQKTQLKLVQTEKMSSLGQLVAGVAHEVNNPINFIHGNLVHAQDYINDIFRLLYLYQEHFPEAPSSIQAAIEAIELDFLQEDLNKILESMKVGTERIKEIVKSLRNFSRLDEAEIKIVDIHEGLDSTLGILDNRLKGNQFPPQTLLSTV